MCNTTLYIKMSQNSFVENIVCDTVEFCGSLLVKTTSSFYVSLIHKILRNFVLKYKNMEKQLLERLCDRYVNWELSHLKFLKYLFIFHIMLSFMPTYNDKNCRCCSLFMCVLVWLIFCLRFLPSVYTCSLYSVTIATTGKQWSITALEAACLPCRRMIHGLQKNHSIWDDVRKDMSAAAISQSWCLWV